MRNEDFNTAEMLRRLKRQATDDRIGDTDDPVTNTSSVSDGTLANDSITASEGDPSAGFTWSEDAWGYSTW